jgi:hypothetical protein
LQVHRAPEQLQSPAQPAKVEGWLPLQPSGKAAPTATMSVAPRDSDRTDRDTFTSSSFKPEDMDEQLVCRVTTSFPPP